MTTTPATSHRARHSTSSRDAPGRYSPSLSPPRSWSSWTSRSSTPRCPPSVASLDLGGGQLQWLVTAYLMMSGGGLLLGGRIADLLPRRTVFLVGLAVFTLASLASGCANNGTELVGSRALQGAAAALLTPSALSLVMTTYCGDQRTRGLALWGAVGSLGVAAGVLVGGLSPPPSGWEFIFWVNGPIGLVALARRPPGRSRTPTAARRPGAVRRPRRGHRHRRPRRPRLRPRRQRHRTAGFRPDRGRRSPPPALLSPRSPASSAGPGPALPAAHLAGEAPWSPARR